MKRWLISLALLVFAGSNAGAHFIFIVPDSAGSKASIVFSENLEPDNPGLLEKIAKTEVWLRDASGKESSIRFTGSDDALVVNVPGNGSRAIAGVCAYGVLQRGQTKPFMLNYYAKAILGNGDVNKPWQRLPLEIIPMTSGDSLTCKVLFQGKPAANAEVVLVAPADQSRSEFKTDAQGSVKIGKTQPGTYGLRARVIEEKAGEHNGKRYEEIRHYSTLVMNVGNRQGAKADAKREGAAPDADASKLLADARAARAQWEGFPGFAADIEVNIDGQVSKGRVAVDARGKISLSGLEESAEAWAKRTLGSIVGHRTDGSANKDTPCAFADNDVNHPLGRAIRVLNDELHSGYRIRDNQIIVVNREMGGSRFSITVLENRANAERKFLPSSFIVHFWDAKTGDLQRTESNHQTWKRVGRFDLPLKAQVIVASKELSTKSLVLSSHTLSEFGKR